MALGFAKLYALSARNAPTRGIAARARFYRDHWIRHARLHGASTKTIANYVHLGQTTIRDIVARVSEEEER